MPKEHFNGRLLSTKKNFADKKDTVIRHQRDNGTKQNCKGEQTKQQQKHFFLKCTTSSLSQWQKSILAFL